MELECKDVPDFKLPLYKAGSSSSADIQDAHHMRQIMSQIYQLELLELGPPINN